MGGRSAAEPVGVADAREETLRLVAAGQPERTLKQKGRRLIPALLCKCGLDTRIAEPERAYDDDDESRRAERR